MSTSLSINQEEKPLDGTAAEVCMVTQLAAVRLRSAADGGLDLSTPSPHNTPHRYKTIQSHEDEISLPRICEFQLYTSLLSFNIISNH